jgi:hypothetical protein
VAARDFLQSFDQAASTTFLLRTEGGPSMRDGGDYEWHAFFKHFQLGTNYVQLANAAETSPHLSGPLPPLVRFIRMRQRQQGQHFTKPPHDHSPLMDTFALAVTNAR